MSTARQIFAIAILSALLALALSPVMAQGQETASPDSGTAVAVTEGPVIAQSTADRVISRVDSLVAHSVRGVEAGTEFVWPLMVRQQMIEGAVAIGAFFLSLIIGIGGPWWSHYLYEEKDVIGDSDTSAAAAALTLLAGVIGTVVSAVYIVFQRATQLLNPEYHALMDIMKALGLGG